MAVQNVSSPTMYNVILRNKDIILPFAIMGILFVMILPVIPVMLDMLLVISISVSILILFVSIYTRKPLDFSVFPSLLLIVTLYRLSLNVASTRLILLHGHEGEAAAGHVIKTFGKFVVGGNYVVGGIIFLILVVINFIVITKGAGRVAEVSARFTLDAMPGKQMSIDADLNAGLINEDRARQRRKEIEDEADFYGAMDGASKFVRGDAIAGILITMINIIGGLIIGVLQQHLPVAQAAQFYTLLTIGDGLVAQIPALIVSTSAGIMVTRAADEANLGDILTEQFYIQPKAIALVSVVIFFIGLIPGFPHFVFFFISGFAGLVSYLIYKQMAIQKVIEEKAIAAPEVKEPEKIEAILPLDLIALEVGYGLISLVDSEQNGELLNRVKNIRRQFALEMGFIVPPIHIRDNLELKPGGYSILVKGIEVARGELLTGHYLAMNPGTATKEIEGIQTKEPAFGLPAVWIKEKDKEQAQINSYTVVDLSTVIATHVTEILRKYAFELLGKQETQELLEIIKKSHPKVVSELLPNILPLGTIQKVLQNLLKERVSIRDLLTICEVLSDYGTTIKDPEILTEYVRQALSRNITNQYKTPDNNIYVVTLEPQVEEVLYSSIKKTDTGSYLIIEPKMAQTLLNNISKFSEKFDLTNALPVIVCTPVIRAQLRKLTEKFIPGLIVLSHNEITEDVKITSLGTVTLNAN